MDASKVVAHAILGSSTDQVQASGVSAFAVLGSSAARAEASKVVAFAVLEPPVVVPPPTIIDPADWVDGDDPVELYTFTVPDTTLVWRYCTDSAPYVFQGLTFIPEAITRSEVTRTIGELSSDVTVEAGDTNPFALQMLVGLSARPVDVLIQRVQRGATSADTVFTGKATSVSLDGPKAAINCVPRGAVASKRKIPWLTYQSGCNWQLFSAGCTLNRDSFLLGPYTLAASAFVGSVMTITGDHENGDLSNGYVERVADGDRRFIEQNVGEVLTLQGSFQNIVDGEQWKVYPGCRRTEADCAGRYNNLVHFLGWERLPAVNPFNRSAFYLAGPTPTAPPSGTTYDLGGGYTLTLAPQNARYAVGGSYGGNTLTTVAISASVDGVLRLGTTPFVGRYISPNPCPASVVSDLDVWFDSDGVAQGSLGSAGPGMSTQLTGSNWDTWLPLTSAQSASFIAWAMSNPSTSGGAMRIVARIVSVHIRVRRRSTGLVLAEGDMSVGVWASVGTTSSDGGGGFPPGW